MRSALLDPRNGFTTNKPMQQTTPAQHDTPEASPSPHPVMNLQNGGDTPPAAMAMLENLNVSFASLISIPLPYL